MQSIVARKWQRDTRPKWLINAKERARLASVQRAECEHLAKFFNRARNLVSVDVGSNPEMTLSVLAPLSGLKTLHKLHLADLPHPTCHFWACVELCEKLPTLKILRLQALRVSPGKPKVAHAIRGLKTLQLWDMSQFGDDQLEDFCRIFEDAESLSLRGQTGVTNEGLFSMLNRLVHLESLTIDSDTSFDTPLTTILDCSHRAPLVELNIIGYK